jgi:deoxyribodipyrimidine photo-lyase
MIEFPADLQTIRKRIEKIDPEKYAATRNYADGAVTHLSPYISRGVISTRMVYDHLMSLDLPWHKMEKLVQELAWRDHWQQTWMAKGEEITSDLRQTQDPVSNHDIPEAIEQAHTGIQAVDQGIEMLYETGYMHNHMRMYVASICCNIGRCHWLNPAKWMYSHLLDGDLASNFLNWQWVAGTHSKKKYYANQDNINKYFHGAQKNTFLDVEYEQFPGMGIPDVLARTVPFELDTPLPAAEEPALEKDKTTLVYNYYNLDPAWHQGEDMQRVLLLEPSFFREYPVSQKCMDFVMQLSQNIDGLHVFVGEFSALQDLLDPDRIVFKEHPGNRHYQGKEEPRDWLTRVGGYFPSFSAFWKKCRKELKP